MTVGSNIKRLRENHRLTQEEFGKIADVSSMAVSQWENDRAVPRMGAVQRIADHFKIPKSEIIDDSRPVVSTVIGARPVKGMEMGYVPLRGKVHMGTPIEPETYEQEMILAPQFLIDEDPDLYACTSEGDCMNRVYPEGCIIFVSPNKPPQNGSVAVVTIDGIDTVMRRMFKTANTLVLSPDSFNSENKDIIITSDDDRTVEFNGKVVWFQSDGEME